jgi:hypothetical protein
MVADEIENYTLKSALNGYQKRVTFTLKWVKKLFKIWVFIFTNETNFSDNYFNDDIQKKKVVKKARLELQTLAATTKNI